MLPHTGRKRPWAKEAMCQSDSKKLFRFVHVNFASHKIDNMFSVHFASMFVRIECLPTILMVSIWKTLWASSNQMFQNFPKTVSDRIFQICGVKSEVFPILGGFCFGNFSTSSNRGSQNFLLTDNMRFRLQHSNMFELKFMFTLLRGISCFRH